MDSLDSGRPSRPREPPARGPPRARFPRGIGCGSRLGTDRPRGRAAVARPRQPRRAGRAIVELAQPGERRLRPADEIGRRRHGRALRSRLVDGLGGDASISEFLGAARAIPSARRDAPPASRRTARHLRHDDVATPGAACRPRSHPATGRTRARFDNAATSHRSGDSPWRTSNRVTGSWPATTTRSRRPLPFAFVIGCSVAAEERSEPLNLPRLPLPKTPEVGTPGCPGHTHGDVGSPSGDRCVFADGVGWRVPRLAVGD